MWPFFIFYDAVVVFDRKLSITYEILGIGSVSSDKICPFTSIASSFIFSVIILLLLLWWLLFVYLLLSSTRTGVTENKSAIDIRCVPRSVNEVLIAINDKHNPNDLIIISASIHRIIHTLIIYCVIVFCYNVFNTEKCIFNDFYIKLKLYEKVYQWCKNN